MPNLMGKKFSYDKKGIKEFQKAKKKMDMMGKKNGGLMKYRDGGVIKYKGGGVIPEQDRVMKKFAEGGMLDKDKAEMIKSLRNDDFKKIKMSQDKMEKIIAKELGSKIGSMEKVSKKAIEDFKRMGASQAAIERMKKEGVLTVTTVGKKRKRRLGDGERSRGRRFDRSYAGSKFID